ncbi:hypothetical protein GF312_04545 [Candidatus Poribacteria bacterium]|nr:hypothetical protein [Candidatus Poribacteria bacterium]
MNKKGDDRKPSLLITRKATFIGLILIPLTTYWVMRMEIMSGNTGGGGSTYGGAHYASCLSLFFNVIFVVVVLVGIKYLLRRIFSRDIISQKEILTVYVLLSMATAVAGTDMIQVLIPILPHPFWFATPENEWADLFFRYIPTWLTVSDKDVLTGFYQGESSLYTAQNLKAWLIPIISWSGLLIAMFFVMFCINIIIRRQWIEREKLAFPIIQVPLAVVEKGGKKLFADRLFWVGFAIAGGIDVYNGLAYLFPTIPYFHIRYEIGHLITESPWNAIGWMNMAFFPFVIGIGYIIPIHLSFSCWFFYLFTKFQRVLGSAMGLRSLPGFPYIRQQSFGAYMGICIFAIIIGRRHFANIIKIVFKKTPDTTNDRKNYTFALLGITAGLAFIITFCIRTGMSIGVILGFFGIYFLLSLAITRMRAELGVPAHDLHRMGPGEVLAHAMGTRRLGAKNLTMFSLFYSFNRAYRSHPMPHSLEAFKIAHETGMSESRMFVTMMMGACIGIIAAMWILLDGFYRLGASARIAGYAVNAFGREPFQRLQNWLAYPSNGDIPALSFMGIGFLFTIILLFLRTRFFWWTLHPLGYALADDYSMQWFWASLLMGWMLKTIILKYGGIRKYRSAFPLFIGLILGEFVIGSLWSLIGIFGGISTYAFKYW